MKEHLERAKIAKNDEFYTPYNEVVEGVTPFKSYFRNKIVYCDCDDENSAFYKFFKEHFKALHLKNLVVSGIHSKEVTIYNGNSEEKIQLQNFGDYKSSELLPFIRGCDIICTNPPFSIFRDYFNFLMVTGKIFLIIAPLLSTGYRNVYPFIIKEKVNIACQKAITFMNGKQIPIVWLTNLPITRPSVFNTGVKFADKKYKKYDNFPEIINVDRVKDIPMDYKGIMGVPITFLTYWNPRQYELLDKPVEHNAYVDGVNKFSRIFIRKF